MKTNKGIFFLVLLITLVLGALVFFGIDNDYLNIHIGNVTQMRWGIDIRGGVDAVFSPKDLGRTATDEEMEAARTVIQSRLDAQNILDADVAVATGSNDLIVRFPWKASETNFDPGEAIAELGEMAELTFRNDDGEILMTGKYLKPGATAQFNSSSGLDYLVVLYFNSEGAQLFADITEEYTGKYISIYLDNTLKSRAQVQQKISGGEATITGQSTMDEARELANVINAGALPFALQTRNYSTISPSLGSGALQSMVIAGIIAVIAICIFMLVYYRLSGLVACVALLLQMIGMLMLMLYSQITVTLPGLAAIILSLAMGVDANIVIAERIRDELKSGKSLDSAITAGFKRAFSAVFDGNLTTLIIAVIMMILGSGTLLSFAYTLIFGILMNFVAGVFANRLMTQSITRFAPFRKRGMFLSERAFKKELRIINFYGKSKLYMAITGFIIVLGIVMALVQGLNVDIQFKGGAIYRYNIEDSAAINLSEAERIVSDALGGRAVSAQFTKDFNTDGDRLVLNIAGGGEGDDITNEMVADMENQLKEAFSGQSFTIADSSNVSALYSRRFLQNGVLAIVLGCVLMVIYVWFSFRRIHGLSAGVTATVALLHDMITVFFAFVVFGLPIGEMFIAVVLTILGYSLNDTIVVYDRMRENAIYDPSMPPDELLNKSLSQVLTRSLNTAFSTLLAITAVLVLAIANGLDNIITFSLPMAVGTITGCYSTLCLSGPLWVFWNKRKHKSALARKKA